MTTRRGALDGAIRTVDRDSASASAMILIRMMLPEWHKDARCAQTDPEAFFPPVGASTKRARSLCNGVPGVSPECPAREQCLAFALANEERHGIWGGLSEKERRKVALEHKTRQGSAWTCVA